MILTHIAPAPLFAVSELQRHNNQADPVFSHVAAVTHTRAEADLLVRLFVEKAAYDTRLLTYRVDKVPLYDVIIFEP